VTLVIKSITKRPRVRGPLFFLAFHATGGLSRTLRAFPLFIVHPSSYSSGLSFS
jgi:hypothetical protein